MGGFDHTYLAIGFNCDSVTNVIAVYDDNTKQSLYPGLGEVYSNEKNIYAKNKGNKLLTGQLKICNNEALQMKALK
jgi:hypothetical protein